MDLHSSDPCSMAAMEDECVRISELNVTLRTPNLRTGRGVLNPHWNLAEILRTEWFSLHMFTPWICRTVPGCTTGLKHKHSKHRTVAGVYNTLSNGCGIVIPLSPVPFQPPHAAVPAAWQGGQAGSCLQSTRGALEARCTYVRAHFILLARDAVSLLI